MNKKIVTYGILLGAFLLSFGGSYFFFSQKASQKITTTIPSGAKKDASGQLVFDDTLPKTEECPLNGVMYSKPQRDWWEKHRPLGVMIENHEDARPQSGLSFTDVVYEAIAEGGITRFLSVFYCQDAGIVGPVRSARTYFLDFISEYGDYPLYTHVGGANTDGPANALGQIIDYGWNLYNDMNQFSLGYPDFYQDRTRLGREVATEHTMYSKTSTLWRIAQTRGLTDVDKNGKKWDEKFVPYSFKDDAAVSDRPASQAIHLEFWEKFMQYAVDWDYDTTSNTYKRSNGGKPHLDRDTNKQLTTKNIVILQMQQSNANDGYENNAHLLYKDKGTGKAIIFMDGKRINGSWKKKDRTSRTQIFDNNGDPIKFDRGRIWFQTFPLDEGVLTVK